MSFIKDFLAIPSRERKGVSLLVALIVLLFTGIQFVDLFASENKYDFSSDQKEIRAWMNAKEEEEKKNFQNRKYNFPKRNYSRKKKTGLFEFDPNDAKFDELLELGFKKSSAASLLSYRKKGGIFKSKSDLKKVYGMTDSLFTILQPYILLPEGNPLIKSEPFVTQKKVIDINTADTSAFIGLKGIGSKLALRIVNYRNRLGGFHSVNQLQEVFGLQPEVIDQNKTVLVVTEPLKQININTCMVEELQSHPYLKFNVAKGIISYRQKHGLYKSVEEIMNTDLVNAELYAKIAPYLTVQ